MIVVMKAHASEAEIQNVVKMVAMGARAVRIGRARLYRTAGMAHLRKGETRIARQYWRRAVQQHAEWRGVLAWGLTHLPRPAIDQLVTRFKPEFTL